MQFSFNIQHLIELSKKQCSSQSHLLTYQHQQYLKNQILEPSNLQVILNYLWNQKQFMLVVCNVLISSIRKREYLPQLNMLISHRKRQKKIVLVNKVENYNNLNMNQISQELYTTEIFQYKQQFYFKIIKKLTEIHSNTILQKNVQNSIRDLIVSCLHALIEEDQNCYFLEIYIQNYFNGVQLKKQSYNQYGSNYVNIKSFPNNFNFLIEIMISFVQEIPIIADYYTVKNYRFNFSENILYKILLLSLQSLQILFTINPHNQISFKSLNLNIILISTILKYQFQNKKPQQKEKQIKDELIQQVQVPPYFKKLTTNYNFLKQLHNFYIQISVPYICCNISIHDQILNIFTRLLQIKYLESQNFKQDHENLNEIILNLVISIINEKFNNFDKNHLNILIELITKNLLFSQRRQISTYQNIQNKLLAFGFNVIKNDRFQFETIEQFINNPAIKIFLTLQHLYAKFYLHQQQRYIRMKVQFQDMHFQQDFKQDGLNTFIDHCLQQEKQDISDTLNIQKIKFLRNCQYLLTNFLNIIMQQHLAKRILLIEFSSYEKQINAIKIFFRPIMFILKKHQANIYILIKYYQQKKFEHYAKQIAIYIITEFINMIGRNLNQEISTKILKILYKILEDKLTIANLNFISYFIAHSLQQMNDGYPYTTLWYYLNKIQQIDFDKVIQKIMNWILKNFMIEAYCIKNENVIDFALNIIKSIYIKLNQHYKETNLKFKKTKIFHIFQNFIKNLQNTIFCKKQFFPKRLTLFEIISVIWCVNDENPEQIYQIYDYIKFSEDLCNEEYIYRYIYDLIGIISQITNQKVFELIVQLIEINLSELVQNIFQQRKYSQQIIKQFLKLISELINNKFSRISNLSHSKIPLILYNLFYYPLYFYSCQPYSARLLQALTNFCNLTHFDNKNLLSPMFNKKFIPIPQKELCKNTEKSCKPLNKLLSNYFKYIYGYDNILQLFPYIEQNLIWMLKWWQEVILRKLNVEIDNFNEIIISNIRLKQCNKKILAKIAYIVGRYNQRYKIIFMQLDYNEDEYTFIKNFIKAI